MDVGQGARRAVDHLVGLGHTDIALLGGPRGSWTNREIRRAATAAARAADANLVIIGPNPPTEDGGEAAAEQVLRSGASAVLAYNDLMAIGLIEGLDRHGARVPQDLSVIGIDDIELSRRIRPKLTTVATPKAAAGRAAVDMLLQHDGSLSARVGRGGARANAGLAGSRANGVDDRRTTAQVTLQTELVIRDSTGPGPHFGVAPGLAVVASGDQRGNAYIKE